MALTIALNRGRILEECLPLLDRAGVRPVEDPRKSRKLIFDTEDGAHRLVIVRSSDVVTYVEHGSADVGITGKDTLLELGGYGDYYERLDLGIGRCRLMTAAPVGSPVAGTVPGVLRVATKFANVARSYYEARGQQVAIVRLSGAMEIAPLMNLADCIVDIVDTGNTLKANGLEPRETIADISSRLIVNRAAMKTRFDAVSQLIERLREVI